MFCDAWNGLRERFDEISKKLNEVKMEKLQEAGLSGVQLNLKISAFKILHEKFRKTFSAENLRKLLKIIGAIWESISAIIPLPPGYMHAIKEFLGALESILP